MMDACLWSLGMKYPHSGRGSWRAMKVQIVAATHIVTAVTVHFFLSHNAATTAQSEM